MDNYRSELTENTPLLDLNHSNHTLVFEGDSRPEDVQKFFNPVLEWLDNYVSIQNTLVFIGIKTRIDKANTRDYFF